MGYRRRARGLKKRYGHAQVAGSLDALRVMEQARKAYRAARAAGKSPRAAHQSAFNSARYTVGAGAWDIATNVQKEMGE